MVHRPSYPYLVSFEKINLFLVLVLSGSLTISISNFVQWIQSSMPILSYPQPAFPKKKKLFFLSIHPDPMPKPYTKEKKKYFTLPHPILSYPILSHLVRIAASTAEGPEFDSRSSYWIKKNIFFWCASTAGNRTHDHCLRASRPMVHCHTHIQCNCVWTIGLKALRQWS